MVSPMMLFTIVPPLILIAGYIYAGDWDSLQELIVANAREIICVIEAVILFILGRMKQYKWGAMMCVLLIMTIVWRP